MKPATINRLILLCLTALVIVLALRYMGDAVYDNPPPDTPAYDIAGGAVSASAVPVTIHTLEERLAKADITRGKKIFGQCTLCHTADKGGINRVGPNLWGIIDRTPAAVVGFNYSKAMHAFAASHIWNEAILDSYLRSPQTEVRGTIMSFAGVKKDSDRADLILYLRSLSDKK